MMRYRTTAKQIHFFRNNPPKKEKGNENIDKKLRDIIHIYIYIYLNVGANIPNC